MVNINSSTRDDETANVGDPRLATGIVTACKSLCFTGKAPQRSHRAGHTGINSHRSGAILRPAMTQSRSRRKGETERGQKVRLGQPRFQLSGFTQSPLSWSFPVATGLGTHKEKKV